MLGNWKMNHNLSELEIFLEQFNVDQDTKIYYGVSPQSIHADRLLNHKKSLELGLKVGAQNISDQKSGAYTGELSPVSAKDLGLDFTLVGHSERRTIYNENDDTINQKIHQGLSCDLKIIFCIGETLEEREAGNTPDVLKIQLIEGLEGITLVQAKNIVIAYEPVWAIGTGKVASADEANDVHQYIREVLVKDLKLSGDDMSIIYGGSVKPENAVELLSKEHIDGGLVGGASLNGESFTELVKIAERSAYLQ
jgi:triosephosphate isomerase